MSPPRRDLGFCSRSILRSPNLCQIHGPEGRHIAQFGLVLRRADLPRRELLAGAYCATVGRDRAGPVCRTALGNPPCADAEVSTGAQDGNLVPAGWRTRTGIGYAEPMCRTRPWHSDAQNTKQAANCAEQQSGAAACRTRPWPPRRAELRPASWFGSLTHQPSSPDCSIIGSLPKVALGVLPAAFLEAGRAGIRDELQLHWAVCTNRLCGTAISTSIKG
jgi:hypothetical protein